MLIAELLAFALIISPPLHIASQAPEDVSEAADLLSFGEPMRVEHLPFCDTLEMALDVANKAGTFDDIWESFKTSPFDISCGVINGMIIPRKVAGTFETAEGPVHIIHHRSQNGAAEYYIFYLGEYPFAPPLPERKPAQ